MLPWVESETTVLRTQQGEEQHNIVMWLKDVKSLKFKA